LFKEYPMNRKYKEIPHECGAKTKGGTLCKRKPLKNGRCKHHGGLSDGSGMLKHGRYRDIQNPRIQELLNRYAQDDEPLKIQDELFLARALLTDYVERYNVMTEGLQRWHGSFQEDYLEARQRWLRDIQNRTEPITDKLESWITDVFDDLQARGMMEKGLEISLEGHLNKLRELAAKNKARKLDFPDCPDPLEFEKKPRQLLDIADAIRYIDTITKIVERVEVIRMTQMLSIPLFNFVTESMSNAASKVLEKYVDHTEPGRVDAAKQELAQLWNDIRVNPAKDNLFMERRAARETN
jgi:hypothetical protein